MQDQRRSEFDNCSFKYSAQCNIYLWGIWDQEYECTRATLATLIARIVELPLAVIFSYRPGFIRLKVHELFVRNKQLSKDFMKCSGPILGASLVWGIGFTSYSSFMGHLGTDRGTQTLFLCSSA